MPSCSEPRLQAARTLQATGLKTIRAYVAAVQHAQTNYDTPILVRYKRLPKVSAEQEPWTVEDVERFVQLIDVLFALVDSLNLEVWLNT